MRFDCLLPFTALGLFLAAACPVAAEEAGVKTTIPSVVALSEKESLSCVSVLEPITDAKLPYAKYGALVYTKLTLKSATGEEEIIYRSPSYYHTDTSWFSRPGIEQEMEVKRDAQRLEVLYGGKGGNIDLRRFRRTDGRWRLTGEVHTSDFDTMTMGIGPVSCDGASLVDFGKVQLNMGDGSKRLLTIDDEGVIWENGRMHEFTKELKMVDVPQREYYKLKLQSSLEEYFAPRDAHGVKLSAVEYLKEMERKKEEQAREKRAAKKRKK